MQWPVTRIVLVAFAAAAVLAGFIQRFVPGGTATRPTLQVIVASVAVLVAWRTYERYRDRP